MELHELTFRFRESEGELSLSFSLDYTDTNVITAVHVDVLEQDDNFATIQTFNYTIKEDVYEKGAVCVAGLSNSKAQYLVCLRVTYSESGVDSTCSRPQKEEGVQADTSCLQPTSIRQVGSRDSAADARAGE